MSRPDHPRIALAELAALTPDPASSAAFARRFAPLMVASVATIVIGCFGAWLLFDRGVIDGGGVAAAIIGSGVLGIALGARRQRLMLRARPVSAASGQAMTPYIVADVETSDHCELAYVDRATGRYSRWVHVDATTG